MTELSLSARIARSSIQPFPMICSCPTTSSRVRGRILAASGDADSCSFFAAYSNRSIVLLLLTLLSVSGRGQRTHLAAFFRRFL